MLTIFLHIHIDVQFSFTENGYRANEPSPGGPATALPVVVSKTSQIGSQVELVVIPLAVDEARSTSLPLPPNIPADDRRSPPFASKKQSGCS